MTAFPKNTIRVIHRSRKTKLKGEFEKIDELTGKLAFSRVGKKFMHLVLDNDKETVQDGKFVNDAINYGISSFTPELMFEKLVRNFSLSKNLYGKTIIREITGHDENYLEKNLMVPEFKKILIERIRKNIENLKEKKIIDDGGFLTEKALELASLVLYTEELDNITPKGILGERVHKKSHIYGDKNDFRNFKKSDRYRDIALKKSVKLAIRRKHQELKTDDLKVYERQSRGQICLIYALDASGSMKGKKIETCKKAGIALAYKAIDEKDRVGLIVFGSDIREELRPTENFSELLKRITRIRAARQTDIAKTIERAIELFPSTDITKHLILLTDAMPTVGEKPVKETLQAVSKARASGITISLVGIGLDDKGKKVAERIAEVSNGKLYAVRDLEDIDKIVLEDYYSVL